MAISLCRAERSSRRTRRTRRRPTTRISTHRNVNVINHHVTIGGWPLGMLDRRERVRVSVLDELPESGRQWFGVIKTIFVGWATSYTVYAAGACVHIVQKRGGPFRNVFHYRYRQQSGATREKCVCYLKDGVPGLKISRKYRDLQSCSLKKNIILYFRTKNGRLYQGSGVVGIDLPSSHEQTDCYYDPILKKILSYPYQW